MLTSPMDRRNRTAALLLVLFVVGGVIAPIYHHVEHTLAYWHQEEAEVQRHAASNHVHPPAGIPAIELSHGWMLAPIDCALCAPIIFNTSPEQPVTARIPSRTTILVESLPIHPSFSIRQISARGPPIVA